jgi:ferritin-like metal-binding protein YciE
MSDHSDTFMRLFNGHLKLDEDTLTDLFLRQLGNIYCSKSHLVSALPQLSARASFSELKEAILEGIDDIKMQILRMDVIYQKFGTQYSEEKCMGIKSITLEAYLASHADGESALLVDMSILTHLRIIESIEITSFNILADIATSLKNEDVKTLLHQNLQSATNTSRMFELISREYIL